MEPGIEPSWIAQARKIAPGPDERFLDRVARELRGPENESSRGVQPRDRDIDECCEGVMIASPGSLDETRLVHGCLGCGNGHNGRAR